jgi:uncharacterized membrane protein
MSTLPLHPAVVHLPLALAGVLPLVFLALLWAIRSQRLPARSWTLGVALQGALLVGAIAALATGNSEEDRVEHTVAEARIDAHARAAQVFSGASAVVLVAALVALATRRHRGRFALAGAGTVLLSLAALGLAVRAGHQGGKLVYEGQASVRTSASVSDRAKGAPEALPPGEQDEDED